MSTLILGIGNTLMQDEGVGVHIVEKIQKQKSGTLPPDTQCLDGGTMGLDLIPYVENKDLVIIVDAIVSDKKPGTIVKMKDDEIRAFLTQKISPHQLGLSDILAIMTLQNTLPKKLILFGIVPQEIETGLGLTPAIEKIMDEVIDLVLKEL